MYLIRLVVLNLQGPNRDQPVPECAAVLLIAIALWTDRTLLYDQKVKIDEYSRREFTSHT